MKRMYDEKELIKLIQEYAPGFDPSAIESGTLADILGLDSDGDVVKGNLFGKYVKIIEPPASSTLTNAEKDIITKGAFINGTFLGLNNPVFFPPSGSGGNLNGICIGNTGLFASLYFYRINASNVISLGINQNVPFLSFTGNVVLSGAGTNGLSLLSLREVNGVYFSEIIKNFAASYDPASTYSVGDLVTHNYVIYKCNADITTPEAWNEDHWTRTTIAEVIASL